LILFFNILTISVVTDGAFQSDCVAENTMRILFTSMGLQQLLIVELQLV